jgi:hypothetical protein
VPPTPPLSLSKYAVSVFLSLLSSALNFHPSLQLEALTLSNATLSSRLDELATTREELNECVKVLDELMSENEMLRREKNELLERWKAS